MSLPNISSTYRPIFEGIAKEFTIHEAQLRALTKAMVNEMEAGLAEYSRPVAMVPTFATHIPNGTETGTFIVVDLNMEVFRVSSVILDGNHGVKQENQIFTFPPALLHGSSVEFFDFIANAIAEFMRKQNLVAREGAFKLGLSFGFAVDKTAINTGKLLRWSKGFDVKDAVGKDVLQLLQDAINRRKLPIQCDAIVNDTVAVLLAQCYLTGSCAVGAIFGTGTNGAYWEDTAKITKLKNATSYGSKMAVNTEWGAFDKARKVLPLTSFDNKVDRESPAPGFQAFEKMISGMYLGEIARNVITSLIDHNPPLLFNGRSSDALNSHWGFDAQHMAMIEEGSSLQAVKRVFEEALGFEAGVVGDNDANIVKWICELVGGRAAKLAGCAVAAALTLSGATSSHSRGDGRAVVTAEGNLIRFYPNFEKGIRETLSVVLGPQAERRVGFEVPQDSMAIGAALAAFSRA